MFVIDFDELGVELVQVLGRYGINGFSHDRSMKGRSLSLKMGLFYENKSLSNFQRALAVIEQAVDRINICAYQYPALPHFPLNDATQVGEKSLWSRSNRPKEYCMSP